MIDLDAINWQKNPDGLVPAIIQDARTGHILMLGYMNEEALKKTIDSSNVTFYSRSKKRLWEKGEKSGNTLRFDSIYLDCDGDTLLIRAIPKGPTCHKNNISCFDAPELPLETIGELIETIRQRRNADQKSSYTKRLLDGGIEVCGAKVIEEAKELICATKSEGNLRTREEAADLLYHALVFLQSSQIDLFEVAEELKSRKR